MGGSAPKTPSPEEQAAANRISTVGPAGTSIYYDVGQTLPGGTGGAATPERAAAIRAEIARINAAGGYLTSNKEGSSPRRTQDMARIGSLQNELAGKGPVAASATNITTLSPEQQAIYDLLVEGTTALGARGVEQIAALPAAGTSALTGPAADQARQAQFDLSMSLLNPEFARGEAALRQRLANQGLPQSSRAFTSELGRFEDTSNQAREQAALSAVLTGQQAALTDRAATLNEILSLLGLQQVQMPQMIAPAQTSFAAQPGGSSPLAGIATGALGGAATGASAGSVFPGYGTAIGAGIGALVGGAGGYASTR